MDMEASTENPTQENTKDYDEWHRRTQAELRSKRKASDGRAHDGNCLTHSLPLTLKSFLSLSYFFF